MLIYFAHFPGVVYNCKKAIYPLSPLPESIISEGAVFASNRLPIPSNKINGTLAVALNLQAKLNDNNYYKTVERLKNLICLSYTLMPREQQLQNKYKSVKEVVEKNLSDKFYNHGIQYAGQLDWDLPLRVAAYSHKVSNLSPKNQKKFWQSLQTFSYARQIAYLPNPQYKYTLYMTLHLASINQLADDPQNLHDPSVNLVCPQCGETNIPHQTSHVEEIIKLIKELIPKEHQEKYIKFMKSLYHPIRSGFIHRGSFAGKEDLGGFIALWKQNVKLSEDDINLMIFNRSLLEQFLVKRQVKNEK